MSILKVDIKIVPLFFQIFYSLLPKIEICFKYFFDKNPKKQSLCPLWIPLPISKGSTYEVTGMNVPTI